MPILIKSERQIFDEAFSRLRQSTGITNTSRGGTARALVEVMSADSAEKYRLIKEVELQGFLSTATGPNLDSIGDIFGIRRGDSLRAFEDSSSNVKILIDPALGEGAATLVGRIKESVRDQASTVTDTSFTIRTGTTLSTNAGISYLTTADVTLSGIQNEVFVPVVAAGVGPSFNIGIGSLNTHDIAEHQPELNAIAPFLFVDNLIPISNGRFTESDESYRFRIRNANQTLQAANATAVINAATSVPGVRDAIILPMNRGSGSFTLLVLATSTVVSRGLVNAVRVAVEQVAAIGTTVDVERPTYQGVDAKIGLQYRPGADRRDIRHRTRLAAMNYINNIDPGESLVITELIQRIMEVDDLIFDLQFQRFSVGTYNVDAARNDNPVPFLPTSGAVPGNIPAESSTHSWYTNPALMILCDA